MNHSPDPAPQRATLWFDVGDLLWWAHSHVTGIQRTMYAVLCELRENPPPMPFDVRFCRFISEKGFVRVDTATVDGQLRVLAGKAAAVPTQEGREKRFRALVRPMLYRVFHLLPEEVTQETVELMFALKKWLVACAIYGGKRLRRLMPWRRGEPPLAEGFRQGDILLNLGSSWVNEGYMDGVALAKAQYHLTYVAMVYDLIPWRAPWYTLGGWKLFHPFIHQTVQTADLLLAISRHTQEDVHYFMELEGYAPTPTEVIRLGELPLTPPAAERELKSAVRALKDRDYVLSVGTIEVRKNHQLLFRVWRALLEKHGDAVPPMVWAGKGGWYTENLMKDVEASHYLDGKLIILGGIGRDGVTEGELAFLYEHCLFTLFPSRYEGWGLPVAEALARGKYCVASNASSIPEIAGDLIDYHDPKSFPQCLELVERAILDPAYRAEKEAAIRAHFTPCHWRDTTRSIMEKVGAALD